MRTALTGEKIAGHVQDLHLATEAAESALRRGQREIRRDSGKLSSNRLHETFVLPGTPINDDQDRSPPDLANWYDAKTLTISEAELNTSQDDSETPVPMPQYKLERFDKDCPDLGIGSSMSEQSDCLRGSSAYRIFGRGIGRSNENTVILQSLLIEGL
jgi:Tfp pilus assembly protein PilX